MITQSSTGKTDVVESPSEQPSFTDWTAPEDREPTEEEERIAREKTLAKGNRTEINLNKAPPGKEAFYKQIDLHNRDVIWKYREDVDIRKSMDNESKRHIVHSIAGFLGLPDLQNRKATDRLFQLDLSRFGYRIDVVAFCLCALVTKEERADRHPENDDVLYHPQSKAENKDDAYLEMESRLIDEPGRTTHSYIQSVWGKLTQGHPPVKNRSEWALFVENASTVQTHPSHRDAQFGKPKLKGDPPI